MIFIHHTLHTFAELVPALPKVKANVAAVAALPESM